MIGRGTRQVSSLSPILVNIYSEAMLRDALSGVNEGIRVGGHLIKTVRFADDQATLASSVKGLQLMMGKMQESSGEYDMKINVKKTKVKKICKRPGEEFTIFLEGKQLSQESSHFNYLGSLITQDGSCEKYIRSRIARKRVYQEKRTADKSLQRASLCLRKRIIKTVILGTLLNGAE